MTGRLWPHQVEAVEAVASAIGRGGRTSLTAACGTGKTRIGGAVASRLPSGSRVLVVVPTIELLVQTLEAYRAVHGRDLGGAVAVCSDPSIADLQLLEGEPDVVVTTTAEVLASSVAGRSRITVLSTYASLPVVAAAHKLHEMAAWDLAVVDEAHRTTGKASGPWKIIHHDGQIPAERRLYMTATPRVATTSGDAVVSMDDQEIYGDTCFRLPFSRAINMGLLADYRVIVPVVTDEEVHKLAADESLALRLGGTSLQPTTMAGQIAVLRTMSEYGVRRAISYHHRVADARTWASTLPATASLMPEPMEVWAGHVSGAQPPHLRRRVLDRLAEAGDELAVVSNARVLNEGVDVPAVDSVVFSRPRRSAIDTIQAVGRALRTGGRNDKVATIVVPLLLAAGESPEAALEGSEWEPVWQVLRALRDHDDRLDDELRLRRREVGEGRPFEVVTREHKLPAWLTVAGIEVPDAFARSILIQAVRATTPTWEEYFGAARAYRAVHGDVDIPLTWVTADGLRLGDWWRRQRVGYNSGDLSEERAELLEELGMVWAQLEESWLTTYEEVKERAAEQGHFVFDETVKTSRGVVLVNWCTAQRSRRRQGKVPEQRIELLDAIGFPWDAAQDRWMRRYDELKQLFERRGTVLRLRADSSESRWLDGQRAQFRNDRLAPWQLRLLAEIGIDFRDRRDVLWHNTYEELAAFHAEEGHWVTPADLVSIDGVNVNLWVRTQRTGRRKGTLDPDKAALLDKIGFPWNPDQERWDARCVELAKFQATHGHIRLPSGPLASWLYQQRKKKRTGKLDTAAEQRLAAIDPLWADERASLCSARTRGYFRLTDTSWERVKEVLPERGGAAWTSSDHRAVIEAIVWKLGTGAAWDDLGLGSVSHITVAGWYAEWNKNGLWQEITRRVKVHGRHS
ncbi:Helicase associated domain protein [Streptomyces sp. NPDC048392]|uniref:Helicase associated domain protein n=1 Tax=Streptomyces sp. NPDC048392 TaxID=3365543 RepID=UPI003711BAC2